MGIIKHRNALLDEPEKSCRTCEHCVFCQTWGDYKCIMHSVRRPPAMPVCDEYKKSKKDIFSRKCRCDICMGRDEYNT